MSAERAERSVARLYCRLVRWDSVPFHGREAPMTPPTSCHGKAATSIGPADDERLCALQPLRLH